MAPVTLGSGVFLGWLAAFFLNWACGWNGGYFEAFPETFSPSHLWPITLSALVLAMALLYHATMLSHSEFPPGLHIFPAVAGGLFLFYLIVHGAYALLWPSIAFTLCVPWALLSDHMMSEKPDANVPAPAVANAGLEKTNTEPDPDNRTGR